HVETGLGAAYGFPQTGRPNGGTQHVRKGAKLQIAGLRRARHDTVVFALSAYGPLLIRCDPSRQRGCTSAERKQRHNKPKGPGSRVSVQCSLTVHDALLRQRGARRSNTTMAVLLLGPLPCDLIFPLPSPAMTTNRFPTGCLVSS